LIKLEIFSTDFRKRNAQISNLTKIRPARAELFHADRRMGRQTIMTKLTVALPSPANALMNSTNRHRSSA